MRLLSTILYGSLSMLALLLLLQSPLSGQTSHASSSSPDQQFVKAAIAANHDQITLGELAQQKRTASSQVKQFADKLVLDDTKMRSKIGRLARQLGVIAPSGNSIGTNALVTRLNGLNGPAFDKAYIRAAVQAHQQELLAFNTESAEGTNPAVKQAARSDARTISTHLKMAEAIAQQEGVNIGTPASAVAH